MWGNQLTHLFYFALHADIFLLQKPWSYPAHSTDGDCKYTALAQDNLDDWRDHLVKAISKDVLENPEFWTAVPVFLVGLSEGVELIPSLFDVLPRVDTVILVSSSALDPLRVGTAQAKRLGHGTLWAQMAKYVSDPNVSDATVLEGRTMRYWRSMFMWSIEKKWAYSPWPVLRMWGNKDDLIPIEMYEAGAELFDRSGIAWCDRALPDADHNLQSPMRDGFQWIWGQIEQSTRHSARHPINLCAHIGSFD